MKTRADLYGQEAASLLRDISMYRALMEEQILRLYPGKRDKIKNLLAYLVKQNRIWYTDGLYCAAPDGTEELDKGLLAAVWVLADFIDRVEYHSVGDYPAKIIFFADGQVYEIVHAVQGKETLLAHVLADTSEEPSNYLVLVDEPEQIDQLQLPYISGYCTVSPDGEVQYYQKE